MGIKQVMSILEAASVFKDWRKENKDAFLAHLFCLIETTATVWQAGFYDKDTDKIISFDIMASEVVMHPPEAVFKKDDMKVKELSLDQIKIDIDGALAKTKELQQRKYPSELPVKKIVVIQTLAIGQVYNITHVTKGFKTLNVKISTATGEVLEENLTSIFSVEPGERRRDGASSDSDDPK